ncbi:MAG TPA: zf-HC2 domain-containing protein [Bryobacteraceae bacterium]|nr:zf-HC2 domain-containing protein [Bryobacteraceae bacterium]
MTCDETKLLLTDYWSQTLGETQELAFEAHIATCEGCHAEAERLGVLWKNLALIPGSSKEFEPGANLRSRFYETLSAYRQGMEAAPKQSLRDRIFALWPKQPTWQMAVSFALLVIGVGLGYQFRPDKQPVLHEQPATPELAQLRGEVSSMRQMVALSLMQQQSAGERLRGVSYAYQAPSSDTEVLSALLRTLNQDDSANVRLAAVDALHQFGASPVTRAAIIQSIPKQDTPLVQIALIDLLVDLKAKDAIPELVKLAADDKVNESVRRHARTAIEKLS